MVQVAFDCGGLRWHSIEQISPRCWLTEKKKIKEIIQNPDEISRLETLATDLIRAFTRDEIKDKKAAAEALCLVLVLEEEDFQFFTPSFPEERRRAHVFWASVHSGVLLSYCRPLPQVFYMRRI